MPNCSKDYIPWDDESTYSAYMNLVCLASEVSRHCPRFTVDAVLKKLTNLIKWLYKIGR